MYERMCALESERYDVDFHVRQKDFEVSLFCCQVDRALDHHAVGCKF